MSPDDRGVQPPRVVLVTGASRFPGGFLVSRLVQDPSIERVVAVDAVSPSKDMMRRMGRAEFVRADIRNSLIGKVIRGAEVDTVVHAATVAQAPRSGSRAAMKDMNVIGAMQLFAVCQKSPSVRKVVLRSASAVYGGSPGDPAKFTEEMGARRPPRAPGPATASTSRLRAGDGPTSSGHRGLHPAARAAHGPAPARMGGAIPVFPDRAENPRPRRRMQLLHEEDALAALHRATVTGPPHVQRRR